MRARTVILALGGVLFINTLIIAGAWWWLRPEAVPMEVETPAPGNPEPAPALIHIAPLPATSLPPVTVPVEAPLAVTPPLPAPAPGAAWAEVVSPVEGEAVPRRFAVSGRCGALPEGSRLMFVIDSGRGVYSPKFPLPTVEGGNFSGTANDFGAPTGGNISLCVFAVTEEGLRQLTEWQAQGKATGKYPPFRQGVPGGAELRRVRLRIASR